MTAPLEIDARGHRCPVPTLRLRKALESLRPGDRAVLRATDPMARIDAPHLMAELGGRVVSGAVVTSRILERASAEEPGRLVSNWSWDALWPALGLAIGLTLLYRYAMSHRAPVAWIPSLVGGVVATIMSTISSWLCAIYVEQIAPLGATYGSVGAVVVLLIWLSWNVNAIFYGGAFATEMEIALRARGAPDIEPEELASVVNLSERRASRR